MSVDVSEMNRVKMANILALAVYLKRRKSVVYVDIFDSFSAAVPADGGCLGSVLLRRIHTNHILEKH